MNKTLSVSDVATVSGPKLTTHYRLAFVVFLILLSTPFFARSDDGFLNARIGKNNYRLILADTPATREKGLSGTKSLDSRQGMLFVFDEPSTDRTCIWMKDMNYDLDILWFDEYKNLIDIKTDVLASSYPETFCPTQSAKYALELSSGTVKRQGIKLGEEFVIKKQ